MLLTQGNYKIFPFGCQLSFVLGVGSSSQLENSGFSLRSTYLPPDCEIMCFQFLLHFTTYFLQHSFMAERLPGKIGTEPQYVIKFFAQWKLVIGGITPLTLDAAGGMNSRYREFSYSHWQSPKIVLPTGKESMISSILCVFMILQTFYVVTTLNGDLKNIDSGT